MIPDHLKQLDLDGRRKMLDTLATGIWGSNWRTKLARDFEYSPRTPAMWMTSTKPPLEMLMCLAQLAAPENPRDALGDLAGALSRVSAQLALAAVALGGEVSPPDASAPSR